MDKDEKHSQLLKGLTSVPKYIPFWYNYDKEGSILYEEWIRSSSYYLFSSEIAYLKRHCGDIVNEMPHPCALVDLGSSSAVKTRILIDEFLIRQETLHYIPVDISEEYLKQSCEILTKEYGDKLNITPIAGVFEKGIVESRKFETPKAIVLFLTLQNYGYDRQIEYLTFFDNNLKEHDRLFISLDITQDKDKILEAYSGLSSISNKYYLNSIRRLNRDMHSDIDIKKFELESDFILNTSNDSLSYFRCWIRSLVQQSYYIPGLQLEITFSEDEKLHFHEGEGFSCKYTVEQVYTLAKKSGLNVVKYWTDSQNHALLACLKVIK